MSYRRICQVLAVALVAQCSPVPTAGAASPGSGVHYVYLIRHGAYDRADSLSDVTANGLNQLGHEQARLTGARLAALPVRPATLVSSTLLRARETAEDIGRSLGMTPILDSLLQECTPTSDRPDFMKNHSPAEIAECDSNLARAWAKYVVPTPGADRHDVLVCHGNVIRWFTCRVVAGDPLHWSRMDIANGSLTIIAVNPDGRVKLVMFSDAGHLPLAEQTWTGKGAGWGTGAVLH